MIRGNRKYIIYSIILLLVVSLTVGFSAFQKQLLIDDFIFNVRLQIDTRVSGNIVQKVSGNAVSNYEDYNVSKIYGSATFPTTSSYVLYKVDLTNYGNVKTGLLNITSNTSGINYQICDSNGSNCTSNPKTSVCNGNNCTLGSTKSIYVKVTSTTTGTKNVNLDLDFEPIHNISYSNFNENTSSFTSEIMETDTIEMTLTSDVEEVSVTGSGLASYNKSTHKLTISNVSSDITINAKYLLTDIAETTYTGSNPNNYVRFNNTLYRIITKENVDDGYGNEELRAKIISASSIGQYPFDTDEETRFAYASIRDVLNTTYYSSLDATSKGLIDTTKWSYVDINSDPIDTLYATDYFALIVRSDFTDNSSWLNQNQFTMDISVGNHVFTINNNAISSEVVFNQKATYPVTHLVSDALVIGGTGTSSDPYILEKKSDGLQSNPTLITGKTLTSTGSNQALVTVENQVGTPYYSVGTQLNASNYSSSGSTTIPQRSSVGTYTVYYYIPAYGNIKAKSGSVNARINGIKYTINYTKGSNVSEIGKTSDTCTTTGTNLTCNVTLPSITPNSGWENGKWNYNSNQYNPGSTFTLNSSNTGLTMISSVTGKTYTATIYYYNGSAVATITRTCTVTSGNSCTFTLTNTVTSSRGVYNSAYKGIASATNSMTSATLSMSADTTFYAIYSGSVSNRYRGTSSYTTRTLYRNEFFKSTSALDVRLATANDSTTNYTPENGIGGSTWIGLSTANDTTAEYNSVEAAAASTSTSLYTIYQFSINYEIGAHVSAIGSTGATCKVTSATSCNVTLPSITPATGYTAVGWSLTNGSVTGQSGTFTLSTSGQTLYANAVGSTYTATFYYYDGSNINTATSSCTVGNTEGNCTVSVPVLVQNSTGVYGSAYKGVSSSTSTMEAGSLTISDNTSNFYANYSSTVTRYYYSSGYKTSTIYRNEYFLNNTTMSSVLTTADNGTTNYTTSRGPGSSNWLGLSTAQDTTVEYSTVQAAANSTHTIFYTVYQFVINYQAGSNVSAVGSDSAICNVTTSDTSCTVVLPTITPTAGYMSVGWSQTNGDTTGEAPLTVYTINTNNRVLYANAIAANYMNTTTNEGYQTLNEAFSAVANNQTIKVMQNVTETTATTLASTKTGIKLDLNGKTITLNNTLTNNGTLDIYNTSSTNGTIESSSTYTMYNTGTLTTNGTSSTNNIILKNTVSSSSARVVYNYGTTSAATLNTNTTITFTTATSGSRFLIEVQGSLAIAGATLKNNASASNFDCGIKLSNESPILVMTSGEIDTLGNSIHNYSSTNASITVSGGTIKSADGHGISNISAGTVNISNGTITSTNSRGIANSGAGTINITGGTITSTKSVGIYNSDAGTVNISDGIITGATGISNGSAGTVNLTGGTIAGSTRGIDNQGTLTLGTNDTNVNTSNPLIQTTGTSTRYGVFNDGGTFNFYDGIIKSSSGTSYSIYGTVSDIPDDYLVRKSTTDGVETAILGQMVHNYQNTTTNAYFESLNAAFTAVVNNQTIKVLQNVTETAQASLASGKSGVKLDLNGKTVTMSSTYIQNNGTLDIYNTSSTDGKINGGSNYVIYNNGTLTLNNTASTNKVIIDKTANNTSKGAIFNNTSKSLTVNANVEIKVSSGTSYGIDNSGTATIKDGTITGTSHGINNSGTLTLGVSNTTVSITNPEVKTTGTSNKYGVYNSGTFNFYDGIIKSSSGTGFAIYGTVSDIPNDYVLSKTTTDGVETAMLRQMLHNYQNTTTNAYFETLNDAFGAVTNNQTIKVMANTTETTHATLVDTKTGIKLDLNGKTVAMNNTYISNSGTLDIYNTSSTDGTITGGTDQLLYNHGTLTLNGTSTTNKIVIEKTADNRYQGAVYNCSSKSITINNNVEIKVSAGSSDGIANFGVLTITGGTITGLSEGIYNEGSSTITGGTITGLSEGIKNYGSLTISGGIITGSSYGIFNSSTAPPGIIYGNIIITGGTIESSGDGIYIESGTTLTLGTKDSSVSTTSPEVKTTGTSSNYGVNNPFDGTFNFYDGIIKSSSGTTYSIYGAVSDTPTNYSTYKETVSGVESAYLKLSTSFEYINTTTNKGYQTLNDAFGEVANNQTIKALKNTTETANATLASTKTGIKLDLNGKTITSSASQAIRNNGTLDIYNTSSTTGIIESSSTYTIYNTGTLTTNGTSNTRNIILRNTSTATGARVLYGSVTTSSATLNTNTTLTFTQATTGNRYLVTNPGTLSISGATLTNSVSSTASYDRGITLSNASATMTMSSGSINTSGQSIYNGSSTSASAITITGGTIASTGDYGVYNYAAGGVSISNATISGTFAVYNRVAGSVNVTSGNISGTYGINNNGAGTLTISGGTISGTTRGVQNSGAGTITITGGTISSTTRGIHNSASGTLILGTNDSNLSITAPSISATGTSSAYGVYNSGGTFNFYDGTIRSSSGSGKSIYGTVSEVATDCKVVKNVVSNVEEAHLIKLGILMSESNSDATSNYLRTNVAKQNVESITFQGTAPCSTINTTNCFDVSRDSNGLVRAYVTSGSTSGKYVIKIGAVDKVYASSGYYLFSNLTNVTTITGMSYFDTSLVTNMSGMFKGAHALTTVDVSGFDTSKVTKMSFMFNECYALTAINVSNFNTAAVTDMKHMFNGCNTITTLNVSNFNTSGVTDMQSMFNDCKNLSTINVSNFNTSNVTDMNGMFYQFGNSSSATNVTITGLENFSTSQVQNMNRMFYNIHKIKTIDLSAFKTSAVTNMGYMFYNNTALTTIYANSNFNTSAVTESGNMFNNCTSLVGGNGTTFSTSHIDKTYARVDATSTPGYFTYKDVPIPTLGTGGNETLSNISTELLNGARVINDKINENI